MKWKGRMGCAFPCPCRWARERSEEVKFRRDN